MIDVALLPLTTSYIPLNFENQEYRQMNPSGFENLQLRKKYMLELAIQRLSQNFQIVSKNGCIKVAIDTKWTTTMSLCDLYYQIKNMKSNLYAFKNDMIIWNQMFETNYLYYDFLVDSFIPRQTKVTLMDPTLIQNFNDEYQNDFLSRDLLTVVFPVQKYVVLYTKRDIKAQEEAW